MGELWDWSGEYTQSRTLKLELKSDRMINEEWFQTALQKTQDLHLEGLDIIMESFHELSGEGFEELKHLHLRNNSSIECIIWSTEWLECGAFTILESMVLEKMEGLKKICDGRINSSSFSKLKVVRVQECNKLTSLFSLSLLENLKELEEIEISDCDMIQQIVIGEQINDDDAIGREEHIVATGGCSNIFFRQPTKRSTNKDAEEGGAAVSNNEIKKLLENLRYLTLRNLPKIKSFFTTQCGPRDESMETTVAPVFFDDQKVSELPKYKEIQSTTHLGLDKLQRIELTECKSLVHFTNYQVLLKLVNLESLTIAGCESLEDIFDLQTVEPESGNVEILPKLYELKLRELPKLEYIWKKNFRQIKACRKLRTVEIYKCDNLLYLSSSLMCDVMENLTEINIGFCPKMETVFLDEEGQENNIALSVNFELTSLKILVMSNCPELKTFLSNNCRMVSTGTHSSLNIDSSTDNTCSNKRMSYWCYGKKTMDISNVVVDTSNGFFNEKVFLPSLESLILTWVGDFEKLWCEEIPDQSYCRLEYLHLDSCGNLLTAIPASMIERLYNLKQLWVMSCDKLEVVFDFDIDWKTKIKSNAFMLPQLQEVNLMYLNNLRHVIGRGSDDEIVVGFPSLNRLEVYQCQKLINLISTTTATTLKELKSLDISWCSELLEVISGEVSEKKYKRNAIIFPRLTSLSLYGLYSLICLSSKSHRFDFTRLKILKIKFCTSLEKLIKLRSNGTESKDEDQANTATQALFNEKIQLPNLEELYILESTVVEELWNEPSTTSSFCKLKFLKITKCSSLQNVIPTFMVSRLQNMERLCISGCKSLQDIFKTTSTRQIQSSHDPKTVEERIVEESIGESRLTNERIIVFTKLTFLELYGNIQLNNMWSGSYTLEMPSLETLFFDETNGAAVEAFMEKVHLPNLEELKVTSTEITELWHNAPLIGSFSKLKRLEVENCGELVKITPVFMLKRLQNLEKLVVINCNDLEIVCELKWLIDVQDSENSQLLACYPFQNLASIQVEKCECLTNLFSISGQHHHQFGETVDSDNIGMSHAASNIFCLSQLTYLKLVDLPKFSHLLQQAGQYALELLSLKEFFLIEAGDKETVTHKVGFPEKLEIQLRNKSHFFGSTTSLVTDIVKALRENEIIIGLLGTMGYDTQDELKQLVVQEEANLFDQVVLCWDTVSEIQNSLGDMLGIVYGESDVQGRAERVGKAVLSYIRNKRLLLILRNIKEDGGLIEAIGIPPLDGGVDPKHFKIILISEEKELLLKMGAKLPIPIGSNVDYTWSMFQRELKASREEDELPTAFDDINTDQDISSFVAPDTILFNKIIKALLSCKNQIIGILGSWTKSSSLSSEVGRRLKKETLIDETVRPDDNEVDTIQEKLETALTITTNVTGLHERAASIHQSLLSNNNKKRLLLLLPNLDEELDLEAVGIPHDVGLVDPKLFKIILTSDKRQVLQNMGAQQIFEIQSDQSSKMYYSFNRIVDGYLGKSELTKLADECGSDEDLAKLLAKKLNTQSVHAWANAFRRLKESPYEYEERKKVIDSL